jgi:hypothetical protein
MSRDHHPTGAADFVSVQLDGTMPVQSSGLPEANNSKENTSAEGAKHGSSRSQ